MKLINVRNEAFETNSSSSHSLTIVKNEIPVNDFHLIEIDDEFISKWNDVSSRAYHSTYSLMYKEEHKVLFVLASFIDDIIHQFNEEFSELNTQQINNLLDVFSENMSKVNQDVKFYFSIKNIDSLYDLDTFDRLSGGWEEFTNWYAFSDKEKPETIEDYINQLNYKNINYFIFNPNSYFISEGENMGVWKGKSKIYNKPIEEVLSICKKIGGITILE